MESMIREYATTLLRNLLGPVVAYLAATGYISESEATNLIVAVVAIVVSVVWGLGNKYIWNRKVETDGLPDRGESPAKLEHPVKFCFIPEAVPFGVIPVLLAFPQVKPRSLDMAILILADPYITPGWRDSQFANAFEDCTVPYLPVAKKVDVSPSSF